MSMNISKSIIIFFLISNCWSVSQNYFNVRASQKGLSIVVKYDMTGELSSNDQVALAYSFNDTDDYYIIKDAEGDVGLDISPGLDIDSSLAAILTLSPYKLLSCAIMSPRLIPILNSIVILS